MIITRSAKVQGSTDYGSEGITISFSDVEMGLPMATTPDQMKANFKAMAELVEKMVDLALYNSGAINQVEMEGRRSRRHWGVKT